MPEFCEVDACGTDLGGACDHCGKRVCEQCFRICTQCADACCCECYDDDTDMCLTCKESGCEGKEEAEEEAALKSLRGHGGS